MVKNWIILGDEAFEGSDWTWGLIKLSKKQQSDWQRIVMEQLNSAIEKSAKVREMIDNSKYLTVSFDFFEKPKVTEEDVVGFMKSIEERFKDKTVYYTISYNREICWISIDFTNEHFQLEGEEPTEDVHLDENGNPIPTRYMGCLFRNLAGEWTEYEYRDVKGKIGQDGQLKIIMKGKEYNLEGIKHRYDGSFYRNLIHQKEKEFSAEELLTYKRVLEYNSKALTSALKNVCLYFVETGQQTVKAMPDENYIREEIDRKRKWEEETIKKAIANDEITQERIEAYRVIYDIRYAYNFCMDVLDIVESKEARRYLAICENQKSGSITKASVEDDIKNSNDVFLRVTTTTETMEEQYLDEKGMPMPSMSGYTIDLRKVDGEWIKYPWRVVKGKVERGGIHKIVLNGKEYSLLNIKHIYEGISHEDRMSEYKSLLSENDFLLFQKSIRKKQYSNKELTRILKWQFLYYVMIDEQTIAAMPNEGLIAYWINYGLDYYVNSIVDYCYNVLNIIESKEARTFVSLYNLSEGNSIVDNNLNLDALVKVGVTISDYSFEATIPNGKRIEYKKAAYLATACYNTYHEAYWKENSDHRIVLMSLLHLSAHPYREYTDRCEKENIELLIYDETLKVTISHNERDLFVQAAKFITDRYNYFQEKYGKDMDEETISRMLLFDVSLNKFEYNNK